MEQQSENNPVDDARVWHGTVDSSGRILIPVELRKELAAEAGTPLVWSRDGDGLSLTTYEETIRRIQAVYKAISPPDDIWSQTLLAERKSEAAAEHAAYQRQMEQQP